MWANFALLENRSYTTEKRKAGIKEMLEFIPLWCIAVASLGKSFALFAMKDLVSWPGGRSLTVN